MTSRKEDRDAIKGLHSLSWQPGNESVWKHDPTIIQEPTNRCPPPGRIMNPFSSNPNGQNKAKGKSNVGNPTAKQTIASGNREYAGRPAKRQKVDPTFGLESTHPKIGKASKGPPSRPPLAPELVDVDEIESSEEERKRRRTSLQNRPSSDELNIPSHPASNVNVQPSKYPFSTSSIAPDGAATVWNDGRYGGSQKDSPGHDSITAYTSEPEYGSNLVKERVAKIEGYLADGPKYDLSKKVGKAKKMQPKLVKESQKYGVSKILLTHPTPVNRDPIASSSTNYKTTTQKRGRLDKTELQLPIKEVYLGPDFHPQQGDRSIALCWRADRLTVKVNEVDRFTRIGGDWDGWECDFSTDPPFLQLRRKNGTENDCVTIKFDHESRSWKDGDYDELLVVFLRKRGLQPMRVNDGRRLWEMVEMSRGARMKEKQIVRATREKIPPQSTGSSSRLESSERRSSGPAPRRIRPSTMDQTAGASNLRRSARAVPQTITPAITPVPDQDEVILVYPPGAPGAVNLTNGDLARLEPGEYLNDTLIEFGLKHWLGELEMSNPEFASKVHVFNSFFYKKLVHKKDPEQAFQSLRKWTSKFDIFQKKYIIVPINENFHWYLAIICEPEHILIPTPEILPTRKDTRSSAKHEASVVLTTSALPENMPLTAAEKDDNITTSSITQDGLVLPTSYTILAKRPGTPEDNSDDDMYATVPSSEAEVERSLYNGFRSSCQIGDGLDDQLALPPVMEAVVAGGDDDDDVLSYASDEGDIYVNSNAAEKSPSVMDKNLDSGSSEVAMVVDDVEANDIMEVDKDEVPTTLKLEVVPPTRFYGSTKAKGKQEAISKTNQRAMDVEEDEGDGVVVLEPAPRTYIFTLDSLGTRHPRAIGKLATYLKLEARDKKGILNASLAQGKTASVPTQPNFCDCGVYLIHFVRTFMADPKRYCHSILNQRTRTVNKDRQAEWHDEKVAGMREDIATMIRKLSEAWRNERRLKAAKVTNDGVDEVNLVESSDSDIVVDDVNTVRPSPKKSRARRLPG